MIRLLKRMRRREWLMAGLCALLVLGQIYFDLSLPDYMSDLTVLIETPGSTVSEILNTGMQMLGCAPGERGAQYYMRLSGFPGGGRIQLRTERGCL